MSTREIKKAIISLIPDSIPDVNGRIYPKVELDKAIEEFNSRVPVICQIEQCSIDGIHFENASHSVIGLSYKYEPDIDSRSSKISGIEISFQILDTPNGRVLGELLSLHDPKFTYSILGVIDKGNTVKDIKFLNFGVVQ